MTLVPALREHTLGMNGERERENEKGSRTGVPLFRVLGWLSASIGGVSYTTVLVVVSSPQRSGGEIGSSNDSHVD